MRKTIIAIGLTVILTYFAMIAGEWYGGEGDWKYYIWAVVFFFGLGTLLLGIVLAIAKKLGIVLTRAKK